LKMLGLLLAALVALATRPASSQCVVCEVWGDTIIGNTVISGLIKLGESQRTRFLGKGEWRNGIPIEVCAYAV
jgi:hypothetical protein